MKHKYQYDVAIIGAGSAGLSLAYVCSQMGLKTVLFEANKMGGDCLNYGCVPSKSLLSIAKRCWQSAQLSEIGVAMDMTALDMAKVMAYVQEKIDTIAPHDSVERFEQLGVKIVQATASFINPHTLSAGSNTYTANKIVIAAGSSPFVPPIPGIQQIGFYTNETIFSLKDKPEHLIIIGGGPIGCEMAQAFAFLGVKVSLFEGRQVLAAEDRAVVSELVASLSVSGVQFYLPAQVKKIAKTEKGIGISYQLDGQSEIIFGSHLLIAVGRRPNLDKLDLENAGVETSNGAIIVDKQLRTNQRHIYAIGDVIGQQQFTHAANAHAGVVFRQLAFKLPARWNDSFLPRVTYTYPELAHVGLTEQLCQEKDIPYSVIESTMMENDRGIVENHTEGKIKLVLNAKGKVLGVSILAERAGELLLPWIQLMREKKSLRSMTDVIVPYPTVSEISKRVASQYYTPKLFSPKVKKLVRWLNRIF